MAQGKKSFVAYADWKEVFDALPNEEAGALIKHIFAYVNDENPTSESVLINAVFANIKNTLKRDLEKWETQLEQRRSAGKKSAEIRSTKSNDRSNSLNETERKSTDSVSVTVSDTVSTKVDSIPPIEKIDWDSLLSVFNSIFGKGAKVINDNTKRKFNARIKDGWKKTDIRQAMEVVKNDTFHKDSNYKHVTIEYFSRDKTLQMYANEPIKRLPIDRQPKTFDY